MAEAAVAGQPSLVGDVGVRGVVVEAVAAHVGRCGHQRQGGPEDQRALAEPCEDGVEEVRAPVGGAGQPLAGAGDDLQLPHPVGDQAVPVAGATEAAGAQQPADAAAEVVGQHRRREPGGERGPHDVAPQGAGPGGQRPLARRTAHVVEGGHVDDVTAVRLPLPVQGLSGSARGDRQPVRPGEGDEFLYVGGGAGRDHAERTGTDDMPEIGGGLFQSGWARHAARSSMSKSNSGAVVPFWKISVNTRCWRIPCSACRSPMRVAIR